MFALLPIRLVLDNRSLPLMKLVVHRYVLLTAAIACLNSACKVEVAGRIECSLAVVLVEHTVEVIEIGPAADIVVTGSSWIGSCPSVVATELVDKAAAAIVSVAAPAVI